MKLEIANKILKNKRYSLLVKQLEELEKDRIFCGHDMEHFMSVARITVILCAEKHINADNDVIYSSALLHDLGRIEEYTKGIPHDIAGAETAAEILDEVGCPEDKKTLIIKQIISHRCCEGEENTLESVFCTADKMSRLCFCCKAQDKCNWSEHKRNNDIGR